MSDNNHKFMEKLKIFLVLIAAFILAVASGIIDDPVKEASTSFSYISALLLAISFMYLHYMLNKYLYPVSLFSEAQRKQLSEATCNYYRQSFFRGTIGVGYICLFMSMYSLIMSFEHNYVLAAVLFVVIGTVSKTRGLILFLQSKLQNEKNT